MTAPCTDHSAKILADSVSPDGVRLTTFEVTFPRYVLAERNTHRLFSRSSASSRAIPVAKRVEQVRENPYIPVFGKNQRGMQAEGVLAAEESALAEQAWRNASAAAAYWAEALANLEVHKQVANRVLEPYLWHTVICSSVSWSNFLDQRSSERSPLADPAIQPVADLMLQRLCESTPERLVPGEYHTPLIFDKDRVEAQDWAIIRSDLTGTAHDPQSLLNRVSAARCARSSYLTHDGRRDMVEDLLLYDRLVEARPMHASPLEHVATPCSCEEYGAFTQEATDLLMAGEHAECRIVRPDHRGNLPGWDQLRHQVEDSLGLDSYR